MNAETLVQFRRQYLCESFQVLLLGGAICHDDGSIPHGWKDVHTLPLHRLRNGEVHAAGRSDFSLLGHPSVDAKNGTMRIKELFKAWRVVPQCQCGCLIVEEAISEQYLGGR